MRGTKLCMSYLWIYPRVIFPHLIPYFDQWDSTVCRYEMSTTASGEESTKKTRKNRDKKKRQKSQGKNVRENNCRLLLLSYALILEKVGESLWVSLSSAIRVTCNLFCWNGEQKWRKKQQSKIVVCYINSLATLQSFVKILKLREKNSLLLISYMSFKVRKCWCV